MKNLSSTLGLLLLSANLFAQKFDVDTLMYNGKEANRINYVILGDGYLETQSSKFLADSRKFTNDLFSTSPFREYKAYFNVFSISVPSKEEGAADDPSDLIDNYFGSTFNYAGIERLLVPTKNDRISQVLANNYPLYNQVVMLVNSSKYGGSGGWVATASTNRASSEIAIHELGHSFAGLSDEYWAGSQYAYESPNMTRESSRQLVKWKNWIGDFGVDVISHTGDPSWKKPHNNCKMQYLGAPFCSVCKEQFVRINQGFVSVIDDYSPQGSTQSDDNNLSLTLITSVPNTLDLSWFLNDERINHDETSLDITTLNLDEGNHKIRVDVVDKTLLDRRNMVIVNSVEWNVGISIISFIEKQLKNRDDLSVVTNISGRMDRAKLVLYPNPVQDRIQLEYTSNYYENIHIELINSDGKLLKTFDFKTTGPGEHKFDMDTQNYNSGLLYIRVKSKNLEQTFKVYKVN
ncbi:MAG: M64 family metallopeptidase [Bacteroidota bacterium]